MATLRRLAVCSILFAAYGASKTAPARTCVVSPRGGDDGPALVAAVHSRTCETVVVPPKAVLNIATKMNMTGLENKHIVRSLIRCFFWETESSV